MSASQSINPAKRIIMDLESDLRDIERWGDVLWAIATGDGPVHRNSQTVVADAISDLGKRVVSRWIELHELTSATSQKDAQP